jgi:hypothetical protein
VERPVGAGGNAPGATVASDADGPASDRSPGLLSWIREESYEDATNLLFQCRWYRIAADRHDRLAVLTADGSGVILKALTIATLWQRDGIDARQATPLRYAKARRQLDDGSVELVVTGSSPIFHTQLFLHCHEASPEVEIVTRSVAIHDHGAVDIERHALVFDFVPAVAELYLKNRRVERYLREPSYWLDRQGAAFGDGPQSAYIYHVPRVSSLEVEPRQRRLIVNLDLAADHPQIVDDPRGRFRDASRSSLLPMVVLCNQVRLCFGHRPADLPRFMTQPGGFVASHVWAEHACFTALPVHKAVYLGSDHIDDPQQATGGFVRHRIPTTKSVFYDNRGGVRNYPEAGIFDGPMVAIRTNEGFSRLLDNLYRLGHDICLHCPQPESSQPEEIEEALAYMRDRYASEVWIDHFWYRPDGVKSGCAESFCSNGLFGPAAALWVRYGVRFFWNTVYEYLNTENPRPWRELLNHWVCDQTRPNPLYWRHPTLGVATAEIEPLSIPYISWPTWDSWYPREDAPRYTHQQLDALVNDWGVSLSHVYTSDVGAANRAWTVADGEVRIGPEFDAVLAEMARLQRDRLLLNTTIRDQMRYWLALERVRLRPDPDCGGVSVINESGEAIADLALVCQSDRILVDGNCPQGRWHRGEYIFWFDLPADTAVLLTDLAREGKGP